LSSTGAGQHADYVFGWKDNSLQLALDSPTRDCTAASCKALTTQPYSEANKCVQQAEVDEDADGCKSWHFLFSFLKQYMMERLKSVDLTSHVLTRDELPSWIYRPCRSGDNGRGYDVKELLVRRENVCFNWWIIHWSVKQRLGTWDDPGFERFPWAAFPCWIFLKQNIVVQASLVQILQFKVINYST
jgi:hypothetical protein